MSRSGNEAPGRKTSRAPENEDERRSKKGLSEKLRLILQFHQQVENRRAFSKKREQPNKLSKLKQGRTRIVQAKKSIGRMPWHQEPTKDAMNCEKPRGVVNKLRSGDIRMGKPTWGRPTYPYMNQIVYGREPAELKHLSRRRKRNQTRYRE